MISNITNDAINVAGVFEEPQAVGEGDLAHEIESKPLQPHAEVALLTGLDVASVELLEEDGEGGVGVGFERDEVAH